MNLKKKAHVVWSSSKGFNEEGLSVPLLNYINNFQFSFVSYLPVGEMCLI